MSDDDRIDGSPFNESCANTNSDETATSSFSLKLISAPNPPETYTTGPVPLYLIPQALSTKLHQHRDEILEVHIRRTRNHQYLITLVTGKEEADSHA